MKTDLEFNLSKLAVPDTGFIASSGASASSNTILIFAAILLFGAIAAVAIFKSMPRRQVYKTANGPRFQIYKSTISRVLGLSSGLVVLAFAIASIMPKMQTQEQASAIGDSLAIQTSEALEYDLNLNDSKNFAYLTDTVKVTAPSAFGYQLSVSVENSETNSLLYREEDEQVAEILATSTDALELNSWGFTTVSEPTADAEVWQAVPKNDAPATIKNTTVYTAANDTTKVHYGVNVDDQQAEGAYKATVVYTAVANFGTFELNFDANGGENAPATQSELNSQAFSHTFTIPEDSTPTRENYSFRGYATAPIIVESNDYVAAAAAVEYLPGEDITISSQNPAQTLYAVWMPVTNLLETVDNLQSVTTNVCAGTTTPTKWDITSGVALATLADARDSKTYSIAKFADGNCWMTQNLALGGSTQITLTPADSDVATNFTLPIAQTSGTTSWDDENAHIYATSARGNYYNFITATAGSAVETGDAPYSICPKNWRLPISNTVQSDFADLFFEAYSVTSGQESAVKIFSAPFNFSNSGNYSSDESGWRVRTIKGSFWSASAAPDNTLRATNLSISSLNNVANPWDTMKRNEGLSIRCVLKP